MKEQLSPFFVLVETQMGENVGMAARAMLNCGLDRLRLVNPRNGWPDERAIATAADADEVLDNAAVSGSIPEAIRDCHRVFAASARRRSFHLPVMHPEEAAREMRECNARGERVAVLFGPEASGLSNDDFSLADTLITYPTNPEFPVLNLAQAVLLLAWEWKKLDGILDQEEREELATKGEIETFQSRLESALDERDFFPRPEMRRGVLQTLRSLVNRMQPSERELSLLQGVLTSLMKSK